MAHPRNAAFEPSLKRQALLEAWRREEGLDTPPQRIPKRKATGPVPLSFAQRRLWFLDQLMPGNSAFNMPAVLPLKGWLNVKALERSLGEILRRHEALRTTFDSIDGEPAQVIHPPAPFRLEHRSLRGLQGAERDEEVSRLIEAEGARPFDLRRELPIRATLITLADEDHIFLYTMHHIASDGWSLGLFTRELTTLWEAFAEGKPSPLPEPPIQYADFAVWQREWLEGEVLERQLSYWKRQLDGLTPLRLPTDRPHPRARTYRGAVHRFSLPLRLRDRLNALGQKAGVTLFMTLLAAFQTLLFRHTGQDDIVVGSPIANRNRAEIEGLIGFFVNSLVLRTDLSGNPTFRELLSRVREVTLGAYAHQDLPFERLVEEIAPERDPGRSPLYQVAFSLQNAPTTPMELGTLAPGPLGPKQRTTRLDLEVHLWEQVDGLSGVIVYNTDLFNAGTVERMVRHFGVLMEAVVADPDRALLDLPILTESERCQLLVEWNQTASPLPERQCAHELFEAEAERAPEAVAVVFEDRRMTYGELNRRANQLAHYLRRHGVGPEVLVGLCLERSPEMIVGLLGVLKAGGAYVPMDPAHPDERLRHIIEDTRMPVLLTQERLRARFPVSGPHLVSLDRDALGGERRDNPAAGATADNLAYVIYTSGTSGAPKGVMIQHRSLVSFTDAAADEYEIRPGDRVLQFASIGFDTSVEEIWPCLARGATLVPRADAMVGSISTFLRTCGELAISVLDLPTAYWHEMVAELETEPLELPPSLRLIIIGGEKARPDRVSAWRRHAPGRVRLVNTYGPTEATVVATWCDLGGVPGDDASSAPIGRPIPRAQAYLLDEALRPVPIGVRGEICIGGIGVARGYRNLPELTAQKFVPHPFSDEPGARLYRTGDLGRYLPDGSIEYLGRLDHQVKIRGFRVEPEEVEAALRRHPAVREAAVLADEDPHGGVRLVAYVAGAGTPPPIGELRGFLNEKLPDYMVPPVFVVLDELPMTPNGKVDRRALLTRRPARAGSETPFVAPRTPAEERLANIWADVLKLERVGARDNFFDLGGHSLLATQVVARVLKAFRVDLPLSVLFENPTIEGFATVIEEALLDEIERLDEEVPQRG